MSYEGCSCESLSFGSASISQCRPQNKLGLAPNSWHFRSLHAVGSLSSALISRRCVPFVVTTVSNGPQVRFHAPPRQHYDSVGNTSGRFVLVVSSCQNVRVRNGPQAIISTLCRFLLYSGVHHTNSGWRRKPFLTLWFVGGLCVQRTFGAVTLVICRCFPFSSTRRHPLSRGTKVAGSRGCFQLRRPRRRQSLRHGAVCRANVCWFVFACGLCVQLAFFCVFVSFSHSYVRRSLPQTRADPGFASTFHHGDNPYCARDISCSLVLRVGSCQLMRIQGLRAVTKVHRQFCRTKGAHAKVYHSRRLPFCVVHNTNLDWHPNCSWHFFWSLHAVGSLCSAPSSHAEVCRCSDSIDWTPGSLPRSTTATLRFCGQYQWPLRDGFQ